MTNIDRVLPNPPEIKPDESFVYVLYLGSECVYVGQSRRIKARVLAHLSSKKQFDRVEYSICKKENASTLEAETIVNLKPSFNKSLPGSDKYITATQFRQMMTDLFLDHDEFVVYTTNVGIYFEREIANKVFDVLNNLTVKEIIALHEDL